MKKTILFSVMALLCLFFKVNAQLITTKILQGRVTDEQGRSLPGASVIIKGIKVGTTTDSSGNFSIKPIPKSGFIVISFIGYVTKELLFDNTHHEGFLIQLKPDAGSLNEVQVIGYGTTTKRFNTGSVATITADVVDKQPVDNPLAALQGRVPGVLVQTDNGLPGGNINILIRGQGSISSGTDPLYIVDGIPFLSSPIRAAGSATGANGEISPFSIINPADIETITILKDADATSIYGSRGANGVILITTKKGTTGKDNFTIDVNQGVSRISRTFNYLNLQQYLKLRNDAFKDDGLIPSADPNSPTYAPDLKVWDTTKSTNWQKYFFGGTARTTNIQTSLSGGGANTHYLASLNYHDEGTILPGNENYQRGGGYLDIEHNSNNKKLTTSFTVSYTKDDNHTLVQGFNDGEGSLPPDFPLYNPDGTLNWSLYQNPIAFLQQKQHSQSSNLNINSLIKYSFFTGFDAKISAGYNDYTLSNTAIFPATSQDPGFSPVDIAEFDNNTSESYIIEPQIDYSKHFLDGVLTALLGGTYQDRVTQGSGMEGDGVSNPDLLGVLSAATTLANANNSYSDYKYESIFGRVNYNWQQKYLLDINLRRDGSSRFGPGKQFGNFYAVGGAWIFSDENFLKDNVPFLSFGKLRSSYGLTGNDQIGDYQYLSTYSTSSNYGEVSTLNPTRIANPNYSWETTKKFEVALELGFLKNRIMLTSAWYRSISGNQLVPYTIPTITGFTSYEANFPAVIQNTGLEMELNTQPIKGNDFNWNLSFNITVPRNKLVSFPGLASSSYANQLVVGQDLSVITDLKFQGVNPQTGQAEYYEPNSNYFANLVVAAKTSPDLFGGFNNTFSYKGVQLDVFFEFVKRTYPKFIPALGTSIINDPAFVANRWEKTGDISSIPGATTNYYFQSSTADYSDASYVRLKNLALSYNLKSSLIQRWGFKELKLSVKGENLFVLANEKRFDPEISPGTGIPPLRTLTAGVKLTF